VYISTYTPLQTALSGVQAAQEELDTTSNNITNANTPGYEEQTVNLVSNPYLTVPAGQANGGSMQIGTGVNAVSITDASNLFLDAAYRTQNANNGSASTEQTYFNQVQSALGEPSSTGISAQLQKFWSDWNSLSQNPTSLPSQQAVVSDAQTLATSFNQLSGQLGTIQNQAVSQFNTLTGAGGQVENDANQIAQLNGAIVDAKLGGGSTAQLEAQRSAALDDLSSLANITVTNNANGSVNVNFGDAASPLISGTNGTTVNWPQTITSAAGGTLGALLNLTGGVPPTASGQIGQYSAQLDAVAASLANEVNNPTVGGATLAVSPAVFTGTTASTLAVNPALAAGPGSLQASTPGNSGDVALAEANLSGGAADQSYDSLVTGIGSGAQSAQHAATAAQALLTSTQNQKQSVEGVDLSVEMTNLVQEQQAYQASARVMNVFDQMMNTLLTTVAG
jgi:flagellar hook-associated protein 1 FlgK